jgi:hypothetical protein
MCQDEPCNKTLESLVGADILTLDEQGSKIDSTLSNFSAYANERRDSLLYDSAQNVNSLLIPLCPDKDKCTYIFSIDSLKDTLQFYYTRDFKLVSQDCGFQAVYELDTIHFTKWNIDSVSIINSTVQSSDEKHLEIYLF